MVDLNFFSKKDKFSLEDLAKIGGCEIYPQNSDLKLEIKNISSIDKAQAGDICFVNNIKYIHFLNSTLASACIIESDLAKDLKIDLPLLISRNAYKSYALIAQNFYPKKNFDPIISPNSQIEKSVKIGPNCRIEAFTIINENVLIGSNTVIGSNVWIGPNVVIGDNCNIGSNTVIQYSLIGDNVTIHPGVKIGQDGFGFASDQSGHTLVPQLGRVIICDDVNIGSNTCIDRGAINDTIIGKGTQIDNLVQIAHNVEIGKYCVIVSQVGIAGSTKVGDFVVIGGQVGIAGHLIIGNAAQIAAKSGVTKDIKANEKVGGIPAVALIKWKKQTIALKKLIKKEEEN